MKQILAELFQYKTLSYTDAYDTLSKMAAGEFNDVEMSAFITAYIMRFPAIDEIKAFRNALLDLAIPIKLQSDEMIDVCGTGGDGKNTFNISTTTSFVLAGAGIKVAKHGNYGVSSISGSSNILEYFGYKFTNNSDVLNRQLEKANICFMHAPLFHPAMKQVGPVRRALKIKTFFNMLGPMVNPARPKFQMVGVYSAELGRLYNYLYQSENTQYSILHSTDGYDEISLTSNFRLHTPQGDMLLMPHEIGFSQIKSDSITGGNSIEESASIFMNILSGKSTQEQKNVVLANSAVALKTIYPQKSWIECKHIASESIDSGSALKHFKLLIENN